MKNLKILAVLVIALLMAQCQKESIEEIPQAKEPIPDEIMKGLNNMGFNTKDYEVRKNKNGYVVEGDMVVSTKMILDAATTTNTKHIRERLPKCKNVRDIRVINQIPKNGLRREIKSAINDWNNVSGSFVKFRLVSKEPADIYINDMHGDYGSGSIPSGGRPGRFVELDPSLYDAVVPASKRSKMLRFVIRHELGHTIGFGHTNGVHNTASAIHIPGTPASDPNSTMNSQPKNPGGGAPDLTTWQYGLLSDGDKEALKKLYGIGSSTNLCW